MTIVSNLMPEGMPWIHKVRLPQCWVGRMAVSKLRIKSSKYWSGWKHPLETCPRRGAERNKKWLVRTHSGLVSIAPQRDTSWTRKG